MKVTLEELLSEDPFQVARELHIAMRCANYTREDLIYRLFVFEHGELDWDDYFELKTRQEL